MEIEVRGEVRLAEGVDFGGEALGDVRITQMLAHHGTVLGLRQAIVVGVPGAGLGELHTEFLQDLGG